MKEKAIKWISFLLSFIMIFSNVIGSSTITVLAEEAVGEATEESEQAEESEDIENTEEDENEGTENEEETGEIESGENEETEAETNEVETKEEEENVETENGEETSEIETESIETVEKGSTEEVEETETQEDASEIETDENEEIFIKMDEKEVVNEDGYILKFKEEFTEESLNMDDWSYVTYEPGRVNNELQEYTKSSENIFVSEGKLVIQANKESRDGADYYTSGRITTQDKFEFKYGRIEARIKVPEATGLLPAFWMMPADEQIYGQWPKSGEIDIMEILGHQTDTVYGTIHYGNPHKQSHEKYTLTDGTKFSEDFHIFSVEWEPGKFTYYVDGIKYHEVNT